MSGTNAAPSASVRAMTMERIMMNNNLSYKYADPPPNVIRKNVMMMCFLSPVLFRCDISIY